MIDICPTVDAESAEAYREQVERIASFAHRVHIDLGDGDFTPNKLVSIDEIWWPGGMRADLHVMYRRPFEHLPELMALGPQLIIIQAEAQGDFTAFANHVHRHGCEVGVALLQKTPADLILPSLESIDHVLIFSGNLGHQGGSRADLDLLGKVKAVKTVKPSVEVGWDGGVDDHNIAQLVAGGVDVVNVGGFIQRAPDANMAYEALLAALPIT